MPQPIDETPATIPIYTRPLDLRRHLPARHPRPHSHDESDVLIVLDAEHQQIFRYAVGQEIRIGRHLGGALRWTNLDLTPYDSKKTISRRHCHIYAEGQTYYMKDIESTNGTWHQGVRIARDTAVIVQSRDYISLGKLGFWIFLPASWEASIVK